MLSVVDHFEPFQGGADFATAQKRVEQWSTQYPEMADQFKDADGKPPQHTWFYPPHLDHSFLEDLVALCKAGYGEVEMHLHHNHMHPYPDTSETLKAKINQCIDDYAKYGIFCLPDGSRRFAFIHGDWSLDNAMGAEICGVNDEIAILKACGCYADFTFPSLGKAQPSTINKIYYVKDDPQKPKSYNRGKEVYVGGESWGDLLMIQGIIGMRWKSRIHKLKPSIESSNIAKPDDLTPGRIDYCIQNAVQIKGRPEWLFIKLHTHGCREVDFDCLFGETASGMYEYLCKTYNSNNFSLHFTTAREMYNIVKAAEANQKGDPNEYRDFIIPRYEYLR